MTQGQIVLLPPRITRLIDERRKDSQQTSDVPIVFPRRHCLYDEREKRRRRGASREISKRRLALRTKLHGYNLVVTPRATEPQTIQFQRLKSLRRFEPQRDRRIW